MVCSLLLKQMLDNVLMSKIILVKVIKMFFFEGSEIMGPGTNVYPFSFVIPNRYVF